MENSVANTQPHQARRLFPLILVILVKLLIY